MLGQRARKIDRTPASTSRANRAWANMRLLNIATIYPVNMSTCDVQI